MKNFTSLFLFIVLAVANNSIASSKISDASQNNEASKFSNKPKLLFIAGSNRKGSYNKMLAKEAFEIAKSQGYDVTFIDLKDYPMPIYDADLEEAENLPKNAIKLKKIFSEHDGIFIACPEYNSSITPLLKNTLDWISRPLGREDKVNIYRSKIIALSSASPSPMGGQRGLTAVRAILSNMGAIVLPKNINIANAYQKFNKEGRVSNAEDYERLKDVVDEFIVIAGKLK